MTDRSRVLAGSRMEPGGEDLQAELSDEHWLLIADLFANPKPSPKGGRPMASPRACFEGVLWMLRSGARWKDLPPRFPSRSTVHRRFVEWVGDGTLERAWKRLLRKLDREGKIDWREGFADGTFAPAKKGASRSARPNAARGPSSWSSPTPKVCRSRSIPRRLAKPK
ncbi:MAG: transposase [Planctomycetota bacterium]